MARNRNRRNRNNNNGQRGQQPRRQRQRPRRVVIQPVAAVRQPRQRNRRRGGGGTLQTIGSAVGGLFGPTGRVVGGMVGRGIASIAGSGDYVLSGPVKSNTLAASTPPMFGTATGETIIRHREYVGDLFSSTDFEVRSFPLSPGMSSLFPWLSRIAANYEQYRFRGLVVDIKSTSSNAMNSTNTALGVVGVATQYDASEPNFRSKTEAENYIGCQTTNPSNSILHFVECARGQNVLDMLYTRTGELGADQDIKFYDLGKLQIFTQGQQAVGANIGEIWVSYEVQFSKPKLPTGGVTQTVPFAAFQRHVAAANVWSGITAGTIEPTYGTIRPKITDNTIYFPKSMPPGRYLMLIMAAATTLPPYANSVIATSISNAGSVTRVNTLPSATGAAAINTAWTATATQYQMLACSFDYSTPVLFAESSITLGGFNLRGDNQNAWNVTTFIFPMMNHDITLESMVHMNSKFENAIAPYGLSLDLLQRAVKWYTDQTNLVSAVKAIPVPQPKKLAEIGKQVRQQDVKSPLKKAKPAEAEMEMTEEKSPPPVSTYENVE